MLFPSHEGVALVPRHTVDIQIFDIGLEEGQRYHLMHDSTCAAGHPAQGRSELCQPGSETTVYLAPEMNYERITETVDQASFTRENLLLQEGETRLCYEFARTWVSRC